MSDGGPHVLAGTESISAEELAQLRNGTLDFARVAHWSQKARGLAAPWPPAGGPLTPHDGRGWLLAVGNVDRWLQGTFKRHSSFMLTFGTYWVSYLIVQAFDPLALKLGAAGALAAGAFGYYRRSTAARRRFLRRARELEARVGTPSLAQAPEGSVARVLGVIAAGPTIPSLFGGVPCVLSRNVVGAADEVRGLDFELQLEDGARVPVSVRDTYLLDRPQPLPGPPVCGPVSVDRQTIEDYRPRIISALHSKARLWLRRPREASVGPGDQVEVIGVVHHEVAPSGQAGPGRQIPMRHRLASAPGAPLLVRRVPLPDQAVKPGRGPVPP